MKVSHGCSAVLLRPNVTRAEDISNDVGESKYPDVAHWVGAVKRDAGGSFMQLQVMV